MKWEIPPPAFGIVVRRKHAQIGDDRDQHMLDALAEQRQRQVVVIDDVVALLRAEDDRDQVVAEKPSFPFTYAD